MTDKSPSSPPRSAAERLQIVNEHLDRSGLRLSGTARDGKRRAPGYLRYAADSQVAPQYRLTLAEHGLLALICDCQWLSADDTVPASAAELALLVRRPVDEVAQALPAILNLGILDTSISGVLCDPQLRAYKAKVKDLSAKRSQSGHLGGEAKREGNPRKNNKKKRSRANATASGVANATASGVARLTPTSTPTQLVEGASLSTVKDPFVEDYERAESEAPRRSNVRRFVAGGGQ